MARRRKRRLETEQGLQGAKGKTDEREATWQRPFGFPLIQKTRIKGGSRRERNLRRTARQRDGHQQRWTNGHELIFNRAKNPGSYDLFDHFWSLKRLKPPRSRVPCKQTKKGFLESGQKQTSRILGGTSQPQ
uniref:Uncharacterized protein n=1 Tax=Bursaphelenchus xylophilus TaxID=6326 RepID=A0A1I7S610_BURXY